MHVPWRGLQFEARCGNGRRAARKTPGNIWSRAPGSRLLATRTWTPALRGEPEAVQKFVLGLCLDTELQTDVLGVPYDTKEHGPLLQAVSASAGPATAIG